MLYGNSPSSCVTKSNLVVGPSSFTPASATVQPGDWISTGYALSLNSNSETTVWTDYAFISLPVSCSSSMSPIVGKIAIEFSDYEFNVTAKNSNSFPTSS